MLLEAVDCNMCLIVSVSLVQPGKHLGLRQQNWRTAITIAKFQFQHKINGKSEHAIPAFSFQIPTVQHIATIEKTLPIMGLRNSLISSRCFRKISCIDTGLYHIPAQEDIYGVKTKYDAYLLDQFCNGRMSDNMLSMLHCCNRRTDRWRHNQEIDRDNLSNRN